MEALRSYTVENAYAAFEENLKGELKTGMLGEVTAHSQDIMKTRAEYTIVGGKIAYQRVK